MYYNQPLEGLAKQVGASDWIKDLWNRLAAYGEISDDAEAATYATNTVLALGPEPTAGVGGQGLPLSTAPRFREVSRVRGGLLVLTGGHTGLMKHPMKDQTSKAK